MEVYPTSARGAGINEADFTSQRTTLMLFVPRKECSCNSEPQSLMQVFIWLRPDKTPRIQVAGSWGDHRPEWVYCSAITIYRWLRTELQVTLITISPTKLNLLVRIPILICLIKIDAEQKLPI